MPNIFIFSIGQLYDYLPTKKLFISQTKILTEFYNHHRGTLQEFILKLACDLDIVLSIFLDYKINAFAQKKTQ